MEKNRFPGEMDIKKVKDLERYCNVKKHEFIKDENEYMYDDLLNSSQFWCEALPMFE